MTAEQVVKIVVIALCIGFAAFAAVRFFRAVNQSVRQAKDLMNEIKKATDDNATTPMSISGAEGLLLQKIKRDFPDFDGDVAKEMVRSALAAYFAVRNEKKGFERLEKICTKVLVKEIISLSETNSTFYDRLRIHKAAVSDYRTYGSEAVITYQAALEYQLQGKLLQQHVYEVKLVYYLDENNEGEMASLICPYCGAPITTFGKDMHCEYCGAEVVKGDISVERTWKVNKIVKSR